MRRIITHPGSFHADDVVACALARLAYSGLNISRAEPKHEDLADAAVFVLDVGGIYDPNLGNFDHHQEGTLPCAAALLAAHLFQQGRLKYGRHLKAFIHRIDQIDRGFERPYPTEFSAIISNRNLKRKTEGELFMAFINAVGLCEMVLNEIFTAQLCEAETLQVLNLAQKWEGGTVALIPDSQEVDRQWRDFSEETGVKLIVYKHRRGGYSVETFDRNVISLPADDGQLFLHPQHFLATFPNQFLAIGFAQKVAKAHQEGGMAA